MDTNSLLAEYLKTGMGAVGKMNPITMGLGLVPSLFQGISGARQISQAKEIEKGNQRPTMQLPSEVAAATGLARNQYLDPRLAGQSLAEERLGTSVANTAQAAADVGAGGAGQLAALVNADRTRQMGFGNLAVASAQQQNADNLAYQSALHRQAPYSQQVWDYNVNQPYQDAAATASALRQAGNTNINAALSNVSTGLINTKFGKGGSRTAPSIPSIAPMTPPPVAGTPDLTSMGSGREANIPLPETPITMNPDGSFPMDQRKTGRVNWSYNTNSLSTPSPVPAGSEGPNFNATGGPMATPITPPAEKQTFDYFNTATAGPFNTATPKVKAPKGSLYNDEFYQSLPPMIYR